MALQSMTRSAKRPRQEIVEDVTICPKLRLNEKTDLLTFSLSIVVPYRTNTFIGLKNSEIVTVNT